MSDIAIHVKRLSKRYRIGQKENMNDSFGGAVASLVTQMIKNFRRLRRLSKFSENGRDQDIIWALKDVSFDVTEGEVLGIIGRNGAGKSTLLKILTRISEPTEGYATVKGRVGSLLEVGTGFHPELTGRENVYLNGAVLGMMRKELKRKFDDIVEFSGVEKFIDTPVKRYSTGMKVRLAFAVAAHLEPEILMVDEVLAVGDEEFQRKCLGKMSEVASGGRTVVFVSHNMGAIARLCTRALWIEGGQIKLAGDPRDVIGAYISSGLSGASSWVHEPGTCCGPEARFKSARVLTKNGHPMDSVPFDQQFMVEIAYEIVTATRNLSIVLRLADSQGTTLLASFDTDNAEWNGRIREPGHYVSVCTMPGSLLRPGRYVLSFGSRNDTDILSFHENPMSFEISHIGFRLDARRSGPFMPILPWKIDRSGEGLNGLRDHDDTALGDIPVAPS